MTERQDPSAVDKRIPRWSAMLLARLAQDRPAVLTRDDVNGYLNEIGSDRDVEATLRDLVKLGWLSASRRKGVWTYLPPGEDQITDPYIDLRAWAARDKEATFALAGEAAAWHLGYLDRRHTGPTTIWIPKGVRPPFGLREDISVVRIRWDPAQIRNIAPSGALLRKRQLDRTRWSDGLPAFGPEALFVQIAARPASFKPWADLAIHLEGFVDDIEPQRLLTLLTGQSTSAWQRAAYLADLGQQPATARTIFDRRPSQRLSHVALGHGTDGEFSSEFRVTDRLAAPHLRRAGKA